MADLLKLQLFHPRQWKEAENNHLLWDRKASELAKSSCGEESLCSVTLRILTESVSLQILFGALLATLLWKSTPLLNSRQKSALLLLLAGTIAIGDFLSNQLKYVFARMRPDHDLSLFEAGLRPSFSLPSNHAFNLFALTLIFWLMAKQKQIQGVKIPIAITCLAILVGVSRVLVGRHFPLDVLAGLILGGLYGALSFTVIQKLLGSAFLLRKSKD